MSVRALRVAAVLVPIAALLVLLHFLAPGLRRVRFTSNLPDGYGLLRELPEYAVYGHPGNPSALHASEVLARFSEAVRAEYGDLLRLSPPETRVDVIVFNSHRDLARYGQRQFGSDFRRNGGFYLPADRTMAVIDRGGVGSMVRALFHEGTHLMLDTWVAGTGHEWSLWLNEGIATWFEDSEITPEGIRLGGVAPGTRATLAEALAAGAWVPVGRLLAASPADFQGTSNSLYYAESCLIVDFLLRGEGGANLPRFEEYYEAERQPGRPRPGTFASIVGDPAEIDARLRRHLLEMP